MAEIVRLALEGAKDSDKVVMTHATYDEPMRTLVRKLLIDTGAKDVLVVFLDIDHDAHTQAVWKRWLSQAEYADSTIEEYCKDTVGMEGIVDFEIQFVKAKKSLIQVIKNRKNRRNRTR